MNTRTGLIKRFVFLYRPLAREAVQVQQVLHRDVGVGACPPVDVQLLSCSTTLVLTSKGEGEGFRDSDVDVRGRHDLRREAKDTFNWRWARKFPQKRCTPKSCWGTPTYARTRLNSSSDLPDQWPETWAKDANANGCRVGFDRLLKGPISVPSAATRTSPSHAAWRCA